MQLFSIITESQRVRCARAAWPFYAIFRTYRLPRLERESIPSDSFLSTSRGVPQLALRFFFAEYNLSLSEAFTTSRRLHWVISPLYGIALRFIETCTN